MAIRSGIGVGEAQIFDTSGVIGTYGRVLAQQQKNDERYASELADLISKVDTEGVREADLPEITKYYDAIKNTYRNALSTKNTTERAAYRAEIANGLNKLNNFANKSVEYKKGYTNLATEFAKNPWMIDSDKETRLKKMASLPLTQLGEDAVIDPLRWMPKPDSSLLNTLFKDVEGELKKKAFERTPISSVAKDGVKYEKFGVKPEEADELIASRLKLSPKAEYSIRSLYAEANPTVTNPTDQDLIKFARTVYESQYGGKDAYTFGDRRSIPRSGGSDSSADSQKLTYRQQLITGLMNQDSDARQELLANLPANSKVEYSISRKVPGISKGGYKFVRLTIPAESTENGIEVREDIPLEAGKPIQKLNYIINQYSPEKISPSKVGISGGKPRGEKFNVQKTQPAKEEIKQSEISSRAKAAGYTVSEYTELLKKNGIKIIK